MSDTVLTKDELYKKISNLRKKIALSDSNEERELLSQQIADLKSQIKALDKKEPKIVPIKKAPTVGEKMEKKIASGGRRTATSYHRNTVRI